MELRIGAADGLDERTPESEQIWHDFATAVELPFGYSSLVVETFADGIEGTAGARLVIRGDPDFEGEEYARIVMAEPFFRLRRERQHLTLLHESMHLAAFIGPLRPMLQTMLDVHTSYPRPTTFVDDEIRHMDFLRGRHSLAFRLAEHLFEMDAELALNRRFREWAERRLWHYVAMQRRASSERRWQRNVPALHSLEALLFLLRCELSVTLATGHRLQGKVTAMAAQLDRIMQANCTPALSRTLHATRADLRLPAEGESVASYGATAYRSVVERVMSLPVPETT